MFEIKGTAVMSIPQFVLQRFGDEAYKEWLDSLPPASRELMGEEIYASSWYSVQDAFVVPTQRIVSKFFGGKNEGAWELGRFNADFSLRGVYKIFVRIGTPKWVLSRGASLMAAFYRPSRCDIVELSSHDGVLHIYEFEDVTGLLGLRIGGFIQRAVEISGSSRVEVLITKSYAAGDDHLEYRVEWD